MDKMTKPVISGIVAEFNPLHKGHEYLIKKAKEQSDYVVAVISSDFVQRGDVALIPKSERALTALKAGVDLVVQLPVCWSMSTAENFALGAISILKNLGVHNLCFGSETGTIKELEKALNTISDERFKDILAIHLKNGLTFASARQKAAEQIAGALPCLSNPNDILAIEYMKAVKSLNMNCTFNAVKRIGSAHDSNEQSDFVSASFIRENALSEDIKNFLPLYSFEILEECINSGKICNIKNLDRAILAKLRSMEKSDFKNLPDMSEGLNNRIYQISRSAKSYEELIMEIKAKRYSLSRIRRAVLSAFIGIDNKYFKTEPPYIRALAFNDKGATLLKNAISISAVPIVTKGTELSNNELFRLECRAEDLYSLSANTSLPCGREFTEKIIKE